MKLSLPETLQELQDLPQWVTWRYVTQDGKQNKIPQNPRTGKNASSTNTDTWADFYTAAAFAKRKGYTDNRTGGIGFMFGLEPHGYAGIDIDDCISSDGKLSDMAEDIIRIMDSYTETSPSGTGIHILFRLDTPLAEIGKGNRNDNIRLEIYDSRRYLTVTGNVYGEARAIAERTEELREVYEKYMVKSEPSKERKAEPTTTVENLRTTPKMSARSEDLSDNELWERIFNSSHGREIKALYNGDISGYANDDSRADLALCSILSWWTHGDKARINRMFRQSGLYRDKWERLDYREWTISRALNNNYEPQEKSGHVHNAALTTMTNNTVSTELSTVGVDTLVLSTDTANTHYNMAEWTPPMTSHEYVSELLHADLERFKNFPLVLSGLKNFDEKQGGFVPGMYVLGATPSLGKTTFMSQICDNMAKQGNFVLFFSLEQSRLEMVTKSLSRLTAEIDMRNAVSSINIRRGNFINDAQRKLFDNAVAKYQEFSKNIAVVELGFDANVSTIADTVSGYIRNSILRPIVIIDYLQILQADKDNQGGRDATECVIRALKRLQLDNSLVMFVISSFNRTNYSARVDYSSFKETGLIEYSCDVLLGMQPTIMAQNSLFIKEKADKEQKSAIRKATRENPRKVMLTCLKNRYGRKDYSCGFTYDARFDLFVPDKTFKDNDDE